MADWIDIPAHRVLELPFEELKSNYDALLPNGERMLFGDYLKACPVMTETEIIRNSDGKRFRSPRYVAALLDFARLARIEEI